MKELRNVKIRAETHRAIRLLAAELDVGVHEATEKVIAMGFREISKAERRKKKRQP